MHLRVLPGVVWALVAALALTVMLMLVKLLGRTVPASQVLFIRQAVIALVVLPAIINGFPRKLVTNRLDLHVLRAVLAGIAMMAGYTAVVHVPLADFTALSFSRALFVTVLAVIFLNESVRLRRWIAVIVGFVGVVIIAGPGMSSFAPYELLVLFGAFCMALITIVIRTLSQTDSTTTILGYQAVLVGLLISPLALMEWVPLAPQDWLLAAAVGITGAVAQSASIRSLKAAPASLVASVDYTRLLWAMLLGLLVFSNWPTIYSLLGASLIILAISEPLHRTTMTGTSGSYRTGDDI